MGVEIERKFLVSGQGWEAGATGTRFCQGYLSTDPDRVVRVRLAGQQAWLTIKNRPEGAVRAEYEYPLPPADARELLDGLCHRPLIDKTRFRVLHAGTLWEVDRFHGDNQGLVLAEIELDSADQHFERPPWLGQEVTDDPRYGNSSLVRHPYTTWNRYG